MSENEKKAKKPLPKPGRRMTFEEAVAATMKQFHKTFEKLARYDAGEADLPKDKK